MYLFVAFEVLDVLSDQGPHFQVGEKSFLNEAFVGSVHDVMLSTIKLSPHSCS
jgi:hypothetical protein